MGPQYEPVVVAMDRDIVEFGGLRGIRGCGGEFMAGALPKQY